MSWQNRVIDPGDPFFIDFLKDYYVKTREGQYLFGSKQPGRRPDRAFYMVPPNYRLGRGQRGFDREIGEKLYSLALKYLKEVKIIVQNRIQGEPPYEVPLRIVTSVKNPQSAYIAWMGELMTFPGKGEDPRCVNYIIPESLPSDEVWDFWPDYDSEEPLTLYDFTETAEERRVLNLGVDYFGGAFKKPNLTMVWNLAESDGLVSYHAGCTKDRILKGLSGTGKTTLTVGPDLEQDDAVLGKLVLEDGKIQGIQLIGLEAASFAKSEGLGPKSPEWEGLMKSLEGETVLAQNIDCKNVIYEVRDCAKIPVVEEGEAGSLLPREYTRSSTTNGRFIFRFNALNEKWPTIPKFLRAEGLSFKRFDILEPALRIVRPEMAVALDSACESIITSAVAGKRPGTRTRSYAATDFMAREQSQQALLKLRMYDEMGLGMGGKLIFFIINTGYIGRNDFGGNMRGEGEKITVDDSKRILHIIENDLIENWIEHPVFHYLIPDPEEIESLGISGFRRRFNPLNFYSAEEYLKIARRDISERTDFLWDLFSGQVGNFGLRGVANIWKGGLPSSEEIENFYDGVYSI